MSLRLVRSALPVLLIAIAACNKPSSLPAAPAATAATIPVSNIMLADYTIQAPASLPAGYATFRTSNSGKEAHQAALVRLDSGKTVTDFEQAMAKPGAPPAWVVFLGGPQNSADVTMKLEPGTYAWYCVIPGGDGVAHMMKGMVAPMTVTAATGPEAAEPVADINVTSRDYQWDFSTPLTAGHHIIKITTAAGQPHEWVLVRLNDGKTVADLQGWLHTMTGPPPADMADMTGIAVMQAGMTNYATVDLKAGNYVLFCMVPDAHDGKDHASHGMVKEIAIQ